MRSQKREPRSLNPQSATPSRRGEKLAPPVRPGGHQSPKAPAEAEPAAPCDSPAVKNVIIALPTRAPRLGISDTPSSITRRSAPFSALLSRSPRELLAAGGRSLPPPKCSALPRGERRDSPRHPSQCPGWGHGAGLSSLLSTGSVMPSQE